MRLALPSWLTSQPIAHRGLHAPGAPENSLAAFEAACRAGYPIELDVHVLRDGEVIVFHDHDLARAAGLSRSLDQEDAHSIRQYKLFGTDQGIPSLRQVFELVAGRVPILVEIKSRRSRRDSPAAILRCLRSYPGALAVQSFDPYVVGWFRAHAPELPAGQLAGPLLNDGLTRFERFASRHLLTAALSRPHFLNYDLRALPDLWVNTVRRLSGLPLLCWTVRTAGDQHKAEGLGLNYVFDHVRP